MGDAGPPTPDPLVQQERAILNGEGGVGEMPQLREVKVLVTGFGVGRVLSSVFVSLCRS
jgi:hypothetical protein